MKKVKSSNIKFIDYDEDESILTVGFKNGSVYEYYDVPENLYLKLGRASSVGSFFHYNIRNDFEYERLE